MKQFIQFLFASTLGFFLAAILMFLLLIGLGTAAVTFVEGNKTSVINENSLLHIKLNKPILDRTSDDPFQNFDFISMKSNPNLGLNGILENINKAKGDDNISGIYLDLSTISAGYATASEIRSALQSFKDESDKFIIAYSEMISQKAYYLASVADTVYLNPEGYFQFTGLSTTLPFFKGAFEKLDIEPQIVRHGKFKSAIEPFVLDKMSDENKEQTELFIGGIWSDVLNGISSSRSMSIAEMNSIADSLRISSAGAALSYNFVDKLYFQDQVIADLKKRLNVESDEKINFISMGKYSNVPKSLASTKTKGVIRDKIAVIYAQGNIVDGEGNKDEIGGARIAKAIREARLNEKVKAIVLRVNSGGGSALASDVMWREVMLAKETKPVVASMGDVAASGGYYMSCAADTIVASSSTITGSIGVLGVMFNLKKFFNNKLGLTFDGVKTNECADIGSQVRPMTEMERNVIQSEIERIYDVFITHVAEGRRLTKEQVDSIGQGRVWCGEDARKLGLVDVIGGLEKAIKIASEMASLEQYRLLELPKQKDPIEEIVSDLVGEVETRVLKSKLGVDYEHYLWLEYFRKTAGIQAIMPHTYKLN